MSGDFDLGDWLNADAEPSPTVGEPLQPSLSPNEIRILNYVEQTFWATGLVPTVQGICENLTGVNGGKLHELTVQSAFRNETFKQQLAVKGLPPVGLIEHHNVLSAEQIVCANLMLNLHDKRSEREKLAFLNISSQKYHAWLRQPAFVEFLRKRGEALFSSSDFLAYKSLVNNVKAGDNKALEMFFQMRGIWKKSIDVNINIDVVLSQVIAVITQYVKDPLILGQIADGIESIMDAEVVG